MNPLNPQDDPTVIRGIFETWQRFEEAFRRGHKPHIEDFLSEETPDRKRLIHGLIGIEAELRVNTGDTPTAEDYASRFPEFDDAELSLLLSEVESLRRHHAPERLGDFRILRKLGQGGLGVVYEAHQESLNRKVALKVLRGVPFDESVRRLKTEALAIARLHHTNIVEVYGSGCDDGVHYFALQYVDGCGLEWALKEGQPEFCDTLPNAITTLRTEGTAERHQLIAELGLQIARALSPMPIETACSIAISSPQIC